MNDKYTVIIPTMWRSPDCLVEMLNLYCSSDFVYQIIIIDNDNSKRITNEILSHDRVKVITNGRNLFVNPAWNWGVSKSKTDKIIIANDDVVIRDFNSLIQMVDTFITDGVILGPSKSCFTESNDELSISSCDGSMNWGWGTFMIMYKDSYKSIPIELAIWSGDDIQFNSNEPFKFDGIYIETKMSTTVDSNQNLSKIAWSDKHRFKQYYNKNGNLIDFNE